MISSNHISSFGNFPVIIFDDSTCKLNTWCTSTVFSTLVSGRWFSRPCFISTSPAASDPAFSRGGAAAEGDDPSRLNGHLSPLLQSPFLKNLHGIWDLSCLWDGPDELVYSVKNEKSSWSLIYHSLRNSIFHGVSHVCTCTCYHAYGPRFANSKQILLPPLVLYQDFS